MRSTKPSRLLVNGLLCLSLTAWLTGCATSTPSVQTLRELPPAELLRDCPDPGFTGSATNGGVILYIDSLRATLRSCAEDKKALREWAKE